MAITQWMCPRCCRKVALDHFATTSCGNIVHPDYAAAVLADREVQEGREGVRVSMSSSCPRKYAITSAVDVAVDPRGMLSPLKGTAWHELMERHAPPLQDEYTGSEIAVNGIIADVPISGKVDRVRWVDSKLIGQDHKTGSDFRIKFVKSGAPIEYKVQLSLYNELYRQQFGRSWDSAEIWWWFSGDSWREPVTILSVEQCLSHKSYGCDYTVAQLLHQARMFTEGAVKWQDLPLVGQSIKFGTKSGCDYCMVRDTCFKQAHGAPF